MKVPQTLSTTDTIKRGEGEVSRLSSICSLVHDGSLRCCCAATHVWWDALDHGNQQNVQEQRDGQEARQR